MERFRLYCAARATVKEGRDCRFGKRWAVANPLAGLRFWMGGNGQCRFFALWSAGSVHFAGGKENAETGSRLARRRTLYFDSTAEFVDNAFNDPQAYACALVALGGEERFKDVLKVGLGNAASGIADLHHDLVFSGLLDGQ